jgi:EAL domain-containing protein (putative c-di-GMP-specific phosphodiesterase class I)/DNA-binding response OmpR family regulator
MATARSRQGSRREQQPLVLILDDDESIGRFVRSALPQSYKTVWARTVDEAVGEVSQRIPDVALVDIGLENESGLDLLKQLRSRRETARTPIIMMTASTDTLDRVRSLRLGADRYLIKPVRAETLRRVIAEMLATRDDIWWTMTLSSDQAARLRELFIDQTTAVPTLAAIIDELRRMVEEEGALQVYCLEIEPLFRLGERDYWDNFDALRREFVRSLRVMVAPILGNDVILATSHSGANDFYCFTRKTDANQNHTVRELERVARVALKSLDVDPEIAEEVTIFAGASVTQHQATFAPRILYNAVREAKDTAERRETRYLHSMRERLTRMVQERALTTLFQPVVDLKTHALVGFEALSRGPIGTEIENPEVLFELARDFDLVWDLEKLCIDNVRPALRDVCSRGFMFFNLESHFIQQLQQRGTDVFEAFFDCQRQVVIEVTERSAIRDYRTFRRTLHDLKALGFRIAIDDCGSGYATLEAVAELQPDYLKVGHSLFRGVEHDSIRRRLVDLVARVAETIGAIAIAEAIETEEQLRICLDLGIQLGQGYYFAAPAPWEEIRNWSHKAPVR